MYLSVVIPVFNEEQNIQPMVEQINTALAGVEFEIVFVDDGSIDQTCENIIELKQPNIVLVKFKRNFGQTSALAAGIENASGAYIATLDGDLQNDPSDIPMMLDKLISEKWDIVSGVRAKRKDGMILRKIPSKIANMLIRKITGVKISDYGCTLKVYRTKIAKKLDLYGELHRFIPILASIYGAKITEVPVKHHSRVFGTSKYGIGRTFKVISDLLLMFFFVKYRQKPMHFFGNLGISFMGIGFLIEFYLLILKLFGENIGSRPLFYVGFFCLITSIQFFTTGFIAELMMRNYFSAPEKKPYYVEAIYKGGIDQGQDD